MRRLRKYAIVFVAVYAMLSAGLFVVMRQPIVFGKVMRRLPEPLMPFMMIIPFKQLWFAARAGHLRVGDAAPEFNLPTSDTKAHVELASFRGQRPVVLVFGSYT